MKKIVLTKKPLTIKELSLFSIILFYFLFSHHDNNENFINLFPMPHIVPQLSKRLKFEAVSGVLN